MAAFSVFARVVAKTWINRASHISNNEIMTDICGLYTRFDESLLLKHIDFVAWIVYLC